ncbi:MAG: hypothetical protein JWN81_2294, partial [Solirubrobacterales bacterium]|nr:hypothetical protein [Solirubrobacterales bacterium]
MAPRLSANGELLFWTATSGATQYVLKVKVPGEPPTETLVSGTSVSPGPYPGLTVHYRVRVSARGPWSNAVSITYGFGPQERPAPRASDAAQRSSAAVEYEERAIAELAEREARERAERETGEHTKSQGPIPEGPRPEGGETAEREARETAEREAREKAEREAKEKAEREAKEKAEREAREKAEREAKEKAEREARERAEREAREKAERETRERAEREAREEAEREAREEAEREAREKEEAEGGKRLIFTPSVIPRSAAEIPNSGRGLYDWQGGTSGLPAGWPMVDYYMRDAIAWNRDLEPSQGHYSFLEKPGVIDQGIAKAAAKGGRL